MIQKANVAIARRSEVERRRISTSPIGAPPSVRRASRKIASSTAPVQAPRATMRRQTSCISRQVNGVTWASTRSRHFPPTRGRGCGSPGSIRAAPPKRLACESATSFAPPTAIESIGEPTSHGSSPTPHRPAGFSSWSRQFAMAGTTRSPHGLPGPGPAATGLFREAASGHRSPSPQRARPIFRHQWPRRAAGIWRSMLARGVIYVVAFYSKRSFGAG